MQERLDTIAEQMAAPSTNNLTDDSFINAFNELHAPFWDHMPEHKTIGLVAHTLFYDKYNQELVSFNLHMIYQIWSNDWQLKQRRRNIFLDKISIYFI